MWVQAADSLHACPCPGLAPVAGKARHDSPCPPDTQSTPWIDRHGRHCQRYDRHDRYCQRYDRHGRHCQRYDRHGRHCQRYDIDMVDTARDMIDMVDTARDMIDMTWSTLPKAQRYAGQWTCPEN